MLSVKTTLENLRKATPGCRVAAYVDLRTAMVLASDADTPPPQEELDGLAARAATLFETLEPGLVPVLTAASQGQGLCQVSLTGRDHSIVAVRADDEQADEAFRQAAQVYPGYAKYRERADHRTIRVFLLRAGDDG